MNKTDYFKKEFSYIRNIKYLEDAKILISLLPDYFFEIAASSTGKYHPSFALGEGGLVRHTKVAVRIAYELLIDPCIGDKYTEREKDLMLISLILHDGLKFGVPKEDYTRVDHPLLVAKFIQNNKEKLQMTENDIEFICNVIETHMGPWNKHPYTKEEVLPIPKNKYQNFVHMCDYLASRKIIDVKFENNDIVE